MKTAAVVSGFERFKGSTIVARAYFGALRQLGYETHWYQCVAGQHNDDYWTPEEAIPGVSTGCRSIDQGLNFCFFFPRRLGRLSEELILLTDPALLGAVDANPRSLVIVHDLREFSAEGRTSVAASVLFFYLLSKIRRVRGILAVSEATRDDLARRVPDLPPTAVIHTGMGFTADGPAHIRRSVERRKAGEPLRFVYVAVDRPYKQVRFVIDLARELDAQGLDRAMNLRLISRLRPSTRRYLDRNPPRSLTVVRSVEDIAGEYETADALLFPSKFEGFGLPIVEAMAFGLPILNGTASAVTELLNGAGVQVDGYDVQSWVNAMTALEDPAMFEHSALRSLARSEHFSPARFQSRLATVLDGWS